MPNPGTFRGSRLTFLDSQAEIYADGVRNNQLANTVADIQCRYLKRYPMTLDHNVEPTQEWLDSVDDSAPDPEVRAPDMETMDNAAYSAALEKFNKLVDDTKARKESIKRRLAYVYSKSCAKDSLLDTKGKKGTPDPLTALKAKLAGVDLKVPRIRTAYNVWGPQNRSAVDPVFNKRVKDGNIPPHQQLALRSSIYKELFEELSDEEQKKWADMAKEEHDRALERLKAQEKHAALHSNADYQRVISALPSIVQPMLDLLCEHTGWKFSLAGGGPEPADAGRLNMIFMHSGVAPGSVSVGFGGAEREAFKKSIMPAFGRYLKRCYSKDACMSRALSPNHGTATLADVRFEEDVDVALYRVEHDKPAPKKRLFEIEMERLNKGKGKAPPPTGTPSPMVRFGPPIGKKKNRVLPTKDNPASLVPASSKVFKSSPLAQNVVTADDSAPHAQSSVSEGGHASTSGALLSSGLPDDMPVATSTSESATVTAETSATTLTAGPDSTSIVAPPPATTSAAPLDSALTEQLAAGTLAAENAAAVRPPPSTTTPSFHVDTHGNAHEHGTHEVKHASPPPSPTSTRAPSLPPSPIPSRSTSPVGLADGPLVLSFPEKVGARVQQHLPAGLSFHGNESPPRPAVGLGSHLAAHNLTGSPILPPANPAAPPNPVVTPAGAVSPPGGLNPRDVLAAPSAMTPPRIATPPSVVSPSDVAAPPGGVLFPNVTNLRDVLTPPDIETPLRGNTPPGTPPSTTITADVMISCDVGAPPGAVILPSVVNSRESAPPPGNKTPPGAATVPALDVELVDQPIRKRTKRARSDAKITAPSKKQRANARAFSIALAAADFPDWVVDALDLLASADLGPTWRQLVELWVSLEAKGGFVKKGKILPAFGRPVVVHDWIKRGREPTYRPDIGNLTAFEATYTSWWRSLQPDWRRHADGVLLIKGSGDWGATKCMGVNGLLSTLAALFYWGIAACNDAGAKGPWEAAVEDAVYVFKSISI